MNEQPLILLKKTYNTFLYNCQLINDLLGVTTQFIPKVISDIESNEVDENRLKKLNDYILQLSQSGNLAAAKIDAETVSNQEIQYLDKSLKYKSLSNAVAAVDAAVLVITHSMLEKVTEDLLLITKEMDRQKWRYFIKNREIKIKVTELIDLEVDKLIEEEEKQFFDKSLKRPLINKIELLHQICEPSDFLKEYSFSYDKKRVDDFDSLRHKIVHEIYIIKPNTEIEEEFNFIKSVIIYLINMVAWKYKLIISMAELNQELVKDPRNKEYIEFFVSCQEEGA